MGKPKRRDIGFPSTSGIRDPEIRRVIERILEWIRRWLAPIGDKEVPETSSAGAAGITEVLAGNNISVDSAGPGKVRVTGADQSSQAPEYRGADSIDRKGLTFRLLNDDPDPGATKTYGTDASGNKGWKDSGGSGSGVPDGTNLGDLLYWDTVTSAYIVLAVASTPSVLAWDSTSGLHWATIDTDYKVIQRNASDAVVGDWPRFHA